MNLSADQTSKIKASVKTKLVEIGAYVDDQLSDYVMIMITNKKTEKQMTEDLELFLGGLEQASTFSSWLHELIKKSTDSTASDTPSKSSSTHHHHHHHHKKSTTTPKSSKTRNGSSSLNMSTNESEELAIQIDTSEFNDDFNDDTDRKNSHSRAKRTSISKSDKNGSKATESPPSLHRVDTSNDSKLTKSETQVVVNPFTRVVENETMKKSSLISSQIGAVIKKEDHVEEYEEKFNQKRLSSVIKVSDRKYSVPKSMQPNKAILLKALDAANSSVKPQPPKSRSFADDKLEEIRSKRFGSSACSEKLELFTANYQKERDFNDNPDVTRNKRLRKFETHEMSQDARAILNKAAGHIDSRKIDIEKSDETMAEEDSDEKKLSTSTDSEKSNNNISINLNKEPKFIVTLTGMDDNPFIKNLNKTPQKRTLSDMNEDLDDQLDYDEDIEEEFMDDENNAEAIDIDEAQDMEKEQKKKLTRCVFWPLCDKGDVCPFLHPNKPCTLFPACTYGNLCHYLHPKCRFDGYCTRLDCVYTHYVKKPSLIAEPPKIATEASADGKTEIPSANGSVPKITINKIQPNYYVNNQTDQSMSVASADGAEANGAAETEATQVNPVSKFSLNNTLPAGAKATRIPHSPYSKSNYSYTANQYSLTNQYSFVNRANQGAPIHINCKYGNMCQNLKCIYVHPNLPQKSQLKWTAALVNTTNISNQPPADNENITKAQKPSQTTKPTQEPASVNVTTNNTMVIQSS